MGISRQESSCTHRKTEAASSIEMFITICRSARPTIEAMDPKLISAPGIFLWGRRVQADPEALYIYIYIYIMFDFKCYVMKIMSKSPSRHVVRLQGILQR